MQSKLCQVGSLSLPLANNFEDFKALLLAKAAADRECKVNSVRSVHGSIAMVHCALPPWRLVLLEGRVASAASYPAWPMTEKARPKVLVFLRLWWMLLGITSEPLELPIGLEACGTHATRAIRWSCVLIENKLSRKKRWFKCKKTKTFGLAPHHQSLGRVARFARNPAL